MSELVKEVLALAVINIVGFSTVAVALRMIYKQSLVFKIYMQLVPGLFVFATVLFVMGRNSVFDILSTLVGLGVGVPVLVGSIVIVGLKIVKPIMSTTNELQRVASTAMGITSTLSSDAGQLADQASEQASSVQETSSSLEEIGGMVRSNLDNAREAYELSNKVREISVKADTFMESIKTSMEELLESNKRIEQLVGVIDNIKTKTEIMDEIVFQTKLLSFNASVEAERAGEHGRGFAVVAQEVGQLAEVSGKSAQEIAKIVSDSMSEATQVTLNNKTKVEDCNKTVLETAALFSEIREMSMTVSNGSEQVLTASQEQSRGIDQINEAMTQIESAIGQSSQAADNASRSSNELSDQVRALNHAVSSLQKFI